MSAASIPLTMSSKMILYELIVRYGSRRKQMMFNDGISSDKTAILTDLRTNWKYICG